MRTLPAQRQLQSAVMSAREVRHDVGDVQEKPDELADELLDELDDLRDKDGGLR